MLLKNFIILLFLIGINTYSQQKYEKEFRIKTADVPQAALAFVAELNLGKRIKWYKEIGLNQTSFEAKTNYKNKKYSIEFAPNGILEDVEIEINKLEIPNNSFTEINTYLTSNFNKFAFVKIQVQYLGSNANMIQFLKFENKHTFITTQYECVIAAKVNGAYKTFEVLFAGNGQFINKKEIVTRNAAHLEY
jgi:hypothetical protein